MEEFESWMNDSLPFDGVDGDSRPDDGWRTSVYNGRDAVGTLEAEAVCAEAGVLDVVVRRGTTADIGGGQSNNALAVCPQGAVLTSTGASIQGSPVGAFINSLYPETDDGDGLPDDSTRAWVHNRSASAKNLTAYALCKG